MSQPPGLLEELKRRKVFRVAVVYAATAFVVLQAADIMLPSLGVPAWALSFLVAVVLLGFPIALVLAWALELTPDGVKVTRPRDEVTTDEPPPSLLGRRTVFAAALLVVLGVGIGAGWFLRPVGGPTPSAPPSLTDESMHPDKSVAVLPFADLSQAGDQVWFVDGLTEEILNSLARLPELKVSARTSSFQFRQPDRDIRAIAEALDVANVVEGSVRRIDEQLRVRVQLIRAADGFHLWSNTYDRTTDDLFEVQRDVAEKIAVTLDVFLDSAKRDRMFASGTRDVEAFQAFLKGRSLFDRAHAGEPGVTLWDANEEFERALALDPEYFAAAITHHDAFAHYLMDGPESDLLEEPRGRGPSSEVAARQRLLADLDHAADHAHTPTERIVAQLNKTFFSPEWTRMPGLIEQLPEESAMEETSTFDIWLTVILSLNGEWEALRNLSDHDIETNPLHGGIWSSRAVMLGSLDEFHLAEDAIERGRTTAGDHPWLHDDELFLAIARRDRETVLTLLRRSAPILTPAQREWRAVYLAAVEGDYDRAKELAEEIDAREPWPQVQLLLVYHETGDLARARLLTARIDDLAAGPAILARTISLSHNMLFFDIADAPNFAARLAEAEIEPARFRRMPRLSVANEQVTGPPTGSVREKWREGLALDRAQTPESVPGRGGVCSHRLRRPAGGRHHAAQSGCAPPARGHHRTLA
jgi:TolB-like protein